FASNFRITFDLVDLDSLTEAYIRPLLWDVQRDIRKRLTGRKIYASITFTREKLRPKLELSETSSTMMKIWTLNDLLSVYVSHCEHKMVNLVVGVLTPDGASKERYLLASNVVPQGPGEDCAQFYTSWFCETMVSESWILEIPFK